MVLLSFLHDANSKTMARPVMICFKVKSLDVYTENRLVRIEINLIPAKAKLSG